MDDKMREDPNEAQDHLCKAVHDPLFFEWLAKHWNVAASSSGQQDHLHELAAVLRGAREKLGSGELLAGALGSWRSFDGKADAMVIKAACARAVQDHIIAEAALRYAQHLAAMGD